MEVGLVLKRQLMLWSSVDCLVVSREQLPVKLERQLLLMEQLQILEPEVPMCQNGLEMGPGSAL